MTDTKKAPELERSASGNLLCGSWVVVQRTTRDVVREIWDKRIADRIAREEPNFDVLTTYQWLTEFNRRNN